jgi:hypothetical protein
MIAHSNTLTRDPEVIGMLDEIKNIIKEVYKETSPSRRRQRALMM